MCRFLYNVFTSDSRLTDFISLVTKVGCVSGFAYAYTNSRTDTSAAFLKLLLAKAADIRPSIADGPETRSTIDCLESPLMVFHSFVVSLRILNIGSDCLILSSPSKFYKYCLAAYDLCDGYCSTGIRARRN